MKKKWFNDRVYYALVKWLRIMKLTFLVLLITFMHLSASVYSQQSKLSLTLKNVTVRDALKEIEEQSDYFFMYRNEEVDLSKNISIQLENKSVETILDNLLESTNITYEIVNRQIVLTNNSSITSSQNSRQSKAITGKVVDSSGIPIPGVTIVVKGTAQGTITDGDGNFAISNITADATLVFSFVGMKSQEFFVGKLNKLDVVLQEETIGVDEVVVVGYGTQKKGELTSSISSVKSDDFIQGYVQDAGQLLQGKVAGLGIISADGDPTSTSQIMLRGIGTLKSNTPPLVIIDGVPGDLTTVAAEDIESLDVVKDGSAAAIYGTRGNNGVIFITTKKVKGDTPLSIEFNSYITSQRIKKKLDMMDATQYRELVSQGKPGAIDYGYETDWLDEITQSPISSVANLSLKKGDVKSNYIANINYRSNKGIIKRSENDVLTTRLEVNHSMWDNLLKFNFNLMGREQTYHTFGDGSSFKEDIYKNGLANIPTDRPTDDNGNWVERIAMYEYANSLALIEETEGENKSTQLRSFGSVTLTPIDQVFIKALFSHTKNNQTRGYSESKKHISTVRGNRNGYATKGSSAWNDDLLEVTGQYRESFNKHNLTALAGYSYQENVSEDEWMENWDFPSDQYTYNNMGDGAALKRGEARMSTLKTKSSLIGFFTRLNYNYNDKYLASFSIRHEGSSKFGADHKWGNFPAASLGWNINKESFMEDMKSVSLLKLRLGFGVTGTIPTEAYTSLSKLEAWNNFLSDGSTWIPSLRPASNPNPDLRWEKKAEWNLGIDYGFFNDRISGSIDLYKRTTKDLLWDYAIPMPPYLFPEVVANAGTIENKGIEFNVSAVPVQSRDFHWASTANFSTNSNKIISLSNDKFRVQSGYIDVGFLGSTIKQTTHRLSEGEPIGNFYGFKTIDIDEEGRWIIEGKDGNPKPIIEQQPDDKKVIGNGLPKYFLSWDNSFRYKKFDLNITMRGAFDYQILNLSRLYYEVPVNLAHGNLMATAYEPKFGKVPLSDHQELQYVSYFIEQGDFWKIDNITLGYNLKLKRSYLKGLRLYISGSNLFTITGYSGIDPEVNVLGLDPGLDSRDRYPSTRSFTFGANLTFF